MKVQTNCNIDSELKVLAERKGVNYSDTLERALRRELNIGLTISEINQKIDEHARAIEELEIMKAPLVEEKLKERISLAQTQQNELEKEEKERKAFIQRLKVTYDDMPEAKELTVDQAYNTEFISEWIDAMRIKYPNKKITMDIRKWLSLAHGQDKNC